MNHNINVNKAHSIYAVYLNLTEDKTVTVGKLGTFSFPAGTYIYIGSAKRNIEARLNRHLKIEKPLRWHFDYLRPYGEITKVETFDRTLGECERFEAFKQDYDGVVVAKGFGSSDCSCATHLVYIGKTR
ncbi:GIY-YIG nuclease family protein [Bacillus tianshenii]|nr:GIY-YIG nuclease family protein [Bacillus tianshenii]